MTEPDPNNPTCFEAFHDLGKQRQWELYRDMRRKRDEENRAGRSWAEVAMRLDREIRRQRVKLKNRAALIIELWQGMEAARAWMRGEFRDGPLGDPAARSWACLWCGEMLTGRDHAREHCHHCPESPLVKRINELLAYIDDQASP